MVVGGGASEYPMLPLFDPDAGELPPRDAVEVYLETPTTLGLLYTLAVDEGQDRLMDAATAAWEAGVDAALGCLRREAGYLKVGQHYPRPGGGTVGLYLPGHLYLTRVDHVLAEDRGDVARLHDHLYIGCCGLLEEKDSPYYPHDVEENARRWPVDLYSLQRPVMSMLNAQHADVLYRSLTASVGAQWSEREHADQFRELTAPALAQYVAEYPRVICSGLPRSTAYQSTSPAQRLQVALGAEPDASPERIEAIRQEVASEGYGSGRGRRLIVKDEVSTPERRMARHD